MSFGNYRSAKKGEGRGKYEKLRVLNLPRNVVGQMIMSFGPLKTKINDTNDRLSIRWNEWPATLRQNIANGTVSIFSVNTDLIKKARAAVVEVLARLQVTAVSKQMPVQQQEEQQQEEEFPEENFSEEQPEEQQENEERQQVDEEKSVDVPQIPSPAADTCPPLDLSLLEPIKRKMVSTAMALLTPSDQQIVAAALVAALPINRHCVSDRFYY
jgi:hypothetical protein